MAKYITVTDLSIRSKEIFDMVQAGEIAIVLRHNKPIVGIVPIDNLGEDLNQWDFQLGKEDEEAQL